MIQINFVRLVLFSLSIMLLFGACRKRGDISLPDNYITFTSAEQGLNESENSIVVKLKLSRNTDRDIPVTINLTPKGVAYTTDFTTIPAAVNGVLNITVPSGNNEGTFTITKAPAALFDGDEQILFEINRSESPILIGGDKTFKLDFKELVATKSSAEFNGGGATFPNRAFIDLSANRQVSVNRTTWDFGFYTDPSDFKVILNSSVGMMTKQIAKNDLAQVNATDTLGLFNLMTYSGFAPVTEQLPLVDYPNGDLNRTAFGLVSANAVDNKVFLVNRGNGVGTPGPARGWKKVRILRNATGGYTIQHADIAAATFTSVDVPKDAAYFFKYFSFEAGPVSVEPEKTKWDIAWNYFGNVTNFGNGDVPFLFQDFIIQNRNVQAAQVLTTTKAYADFKEADLASLILNPAQNAIGSSWRLGGGPTTQPSVRDDRYYIIKDGNNNYYKLIFIRMTKGGERGYVRIDYELVKRG
ncbi:MAG: HmuY family protein [Chitinophagaceae bacterium]